MGRDGVRYEVTSHPELVDKLGVLREATHAPEELRLDPNMPRPSNAQYREPTLDDLLFVDLNMGDDPKGKAKMHEEGSNWEIVQYISVTMVSQDDPIKVVYKDTQEGYYATTRLPTLDLPIAHVLVVEKLVGHRNHIKDQRGNEYRTMEWTKIRNLRWQGRLLFQEVSLGATARPGEMAYHGQTFAPPMREFFREGPTLSERTTLRGPNIEPRTSPSP